MNNFSSKLAEKIGILVQGGTVNVGEIRLDGEMSRQEFRNRKALLNNVRTAWVEGVLEKSLHEQIPIVLGLETRPDAIASPWNLDVINPDQSRQPLQTGTPVIDVFDRLGEGGTLLILGEAGSGKTITLLQLARDLIARAEKEIDHRIPIVLNLSSWAAEKQTIAQWVVEELNNKYQVKRNIGQQWVEKQELLLLLDGLDEIRDFGKRNDCVTALNTFQQDQATEMVVCCRLKDYEKLGDRLKLKSALVLQSLTNDQIHAYLNQLKSDLTILKTFLTEDKELQELAQSPLLLNIMLLTYQDINILNTSLNTITLNRKKQLFDDYINRMFQSSRIVAYKPNSLLLEKHHYSRKDTTRWLVWIAKKMIQHSQTIFLIEKMQTHWLNDRDIIFYPIVSLLITTIFIGSLMAWGSGGSFSNLSDWISALLWWGMIDGFIISDIKPVESVIWHWKDFKINFLKWLKTCLIGGLLGGLLCGLIGIVFMFGSIGLIGGLRNGLFVWFIVGLYSGFIFGIISGLIVGMNKGLIGSEVEAKIYPNQGIRKSAINALIYGLIGITISILLGLLISEEFSRKVLQLIIVLIGFMRFGGQAFMQHCVLRLILYFTKRAPWNYANFLDWASDKLFLQKVGGGYIFIHRSLMEHFAEMENGQ